MFLVPCSVFTTPYLAGIEEQLNENNPEENRFFYHPDHLGSSSFITDADGEGYQHLQYLPFGETFVSQKLAEWSTPYQFTGKEKDDETGYNYFGVRYYNSDISVWLSVDPLAYERSWLSPYNYCQLKPLVFVDTDGMLDWHPDGKGNLIADKWDDAFSLATYLGVSFKEAYSYTSNIDNWDEEAKQNGILVGEEAGHVLSIPDVGIRAGNIAEFYLGSEKWKTMAKTGNYGRGTFKCNVFVGEVTTSAGGSPGTPVLLNPTRSRLPLVKKKFGYPLAEQWADPDYYIPGWRVLGENETPRRGDVAAYENPNAIRATGHTAVVHVPGFTIGTSSQSGGRITRTDFGFNLMRSHNTPITYRRYDPNH